MKDEIAAGVLGLVGLTQIAFIGLKAFGVVQWSWFWVLSPVWLPAFLFIAIVCLCLVGMGIGAIFKKS